MTEYDIPEGYIIATMGHYPERTDYQYSVQLLNQTNGDIPRGTGASPEQALVEAIKRARPEMTQEEHMNEVLRAGQLLADLAEGKIDKINVV